jgi:hypothetical protein
LHHDNGAIFFSLNPIPCSTLIFPFLLILAMSYPFAPPPPPPNSRPSGPVDSRSASGSRGSRPSRGNRGGHGGRDGRSGSFEQYSSPGNKQSYAAQNPPQAAYSYPSWDSAPSSSTLPQYPQYAASQSTPSSYGAGIPYTQPAYPTSSYHTHSQPSIYGSALTTSSYGQPSTYGSGAQYGTSPMTHSVPQYPPQSAYLPPYSFPSSATAHQTPYFHYSASGQPDAQYPPPQVHDARSHFGRGHSQGSSHRDQRSSFRNKFNATPKSFPGQKRKREHSPSAFQSGKSGSSGHPSSGSNNRRNDRAKVNLPPQVPNFGFAGLPKKPDLVIPPLASSSSHRPFKKKRSGKKRKANQLGLTPKTELHEESDDATIEDEEEAFRQSGKP